MRKVELDHLVYLAELDETSGLLWLTNDETKAELKLTPQATFDLYAFLCDGCDLPTCSNHLHTHTRMRTVAPFVLQTDNLCPTCYAEFQASFEEMQDADTQATDDRPNLDQDTDTTPKKLTQVPASERVSLDGTSSTNTLGFLPSRSYSTREGGDWQPEGGPYARMSLS